MNAKFWIATRQIQPANSRAVKPIKLIILGAVMALFCNIASAQDDNSYGPNGPSSEITTGGDYNAYTACARRTITDISVPSVSKYPLEFTRTSVSRGAS